MQDILKRMLTELHQACLKPNGFKKTGGHFQRTEGVAIQKLLFHSSRWNYAGSPVNFFICISLQFTDITFDDGSLAFIPISTLPQIVPDAPPCFDLTAANYERIRNQLLEILPRLFLEWPKHYEHARSQLKNVKQLRDESKQLKAFCKDGKTADEIAAQFPSVGSARLDKEVKKKRLRVSGSKYHPY